MVCLQVKQTILKPLKYQKRKNYEVLGKCLNAMPVWAYNKQIWYLFKNGLYYNMCN